MVPQDKSIAAANVEAQRLPSPIIGLRMARWIIVLISGAAEQHGAHPEHGGERTPVAGDGGPQCPVGTAGDSAQRWSASFRAFRRMKRPESKEAPSSRTSVKTCARTAAVSATSRRQAKPGRARASFEKSTR